MKNRNSIYAAAYARKILDLSIKDLISLRVSKKSKSSNKPIDKHGNYDGTDVGFTSDSIETTTKQKKTKIDGSNYGSTDAGFTSKL